MTNGNHSDLCHSPAESRLSETVRSNVLGQAARPAKRGTWEPAAAVLNEQCPVSRRHCGHKRRLVLGGREGGRGEESEGKSES